MPSSQENGTQSFRRCERASCRALDCATSRLAVAMKLPLSSMISNGLSREAQCSVYRRPIRRGQELFPQFGADGGGRA